MIRTLDWDQGDEQLNFVRGGNGDIYIQIWFTEYDHVLENVVRKCRSVRIGCGNSDGDLIPYLVKKPLCEAAQHYINEYGVISEFHENKIWKATEDNHKIW